MIGVILFDHKTNERTRQETQIWGIRYNIKELSRKWAGHVTRISDKRWISRVRSLPFGNPDHSEKGEEDQTRDGEMKLHVSSEWNG